MPYRGRSLPKPGETEGKLFTSSGFSDYLYYSEMLHIIDIGGSGGKRGHQDYDKLAHTNFAEVVDRPSRRDVGIWHCDAFVKKNSGRGFKRAPYLILDRGVTLGCTERYRLIKSRRDSSWPTGVTGVGQSAFPDVGIRLFLMPDKNAAISSPVYWKKLGIGHNYLEPLKLVVPIILRMHGPRSGIVPGAAYTNSAMRKTVAHILPERGVPPDVCAVIVGHTAVAASGIKLDKQAPSYQEQLAMDLESQVKASLIMSDDPAVASFTWESVVPPRLMTIIRQTLPSRIKACDLDCRIIARELLRDEDAYPRYWAYDDFPTPRARARPSASAFLVPRSSLFVVRCSLFVDR